MVIWVFAGGGETEAGGLIKFLQKLFPNYQFTRYTPFNSTKKGAKPNTEKSRKKESTFGITHKSLIESIKKYLPIAFEKEKQLPHLILVVDDLDCCDLATQHQNFLDCITKVLDQEKDKLKRGHSETFHPDNVKQYIAFAAPEIEAWIIADWDHTLGKAEKFKGRHERMRVYLSREKKVPFDKPETFGELNKERTACREKLSDLLIEASSQQFEDQGKAYRKATDSPELLLRIDKTKVCAKCPIFKDFYNHLVELKLEIMP